MPHQPGTRWPQLFALMVVVLAGLATSPLPTEAQATPKLVISFLDVGQGDATLLITPSGGSVLVNCGSPAQSKQLILRLESAGISQIDTLVLTSVRTDAAGGCADVLNYLSVGQVIWSGQRSSNAVLAAFQKSLQSNLPSVLTPTASPLRRDWGDGIRATVLVPSATADPDGSLGVLVEYAGTRTLLSGSQDVDGPSVDVLHVSGVTTVNGRALSSAANGTIVVSISPDGTPPVVQTER